MVEIDFLQSAFSIKLQFLLPMRRCLISPNASGYCINIMSSRIRLDDSDGRVCVFVAAGVYIGIFRMFQGTRPPHIKGTTQFVTNLFNNNVCYLIS